MGAAAAFKAAWSQVKVLASRDETLAADQSFDWCGGCRIMATPGHTPGHISLWLPEHKTVIAGDAMALEEGRPVIANPQFTLDMAEAEASMHKLLALPVQTIICYHGGLYRPAEHRDTGSRRDS